ncbi:MAG: hydrogenase iron-sulfur subunit [Deltaproteobacteria bacterium]|nr:hydrogenase iron-sulfur subunit [Deltaproteobacteria bacterium]
MTPSASPDIVVYICCNCIAKEARLPRQWQENGAHVLVREMPCSGKMDARYLLHAFEGGSRGLCVVACPKGECRLAQGNYRAEIRVGVVRRLLAEIGVEAERVELLHVSPNDPPDRLEPVLRDAVRRICSLGAITPSALNSAGKADSAGSAPGG